MNKDILRIAIPSIISNITVPLLSLVDTTIVGHLGTTTYIGAIAVGSMLFNMIYWLFGFLRMGTGGLTAQAYGGNDTQASYHILIRSLSVSACFSLLIFTLQQPIVSIAFRFIDTTPEIESLARLYFNILIWGAPAVLGLYSFIGWFLGMQNARVPMMIAIVQNITNIVVSLGLVYGLDWKVEGVATGTLVAQYSGLLMAITIWRFRYHDKMRVSDWRQILHTEEIRKFFNVNRDIFLRTLCIIAVTTYFTSAGAGLGELQLAANTLLMQFFIMFSYIMDGYAYAAEALSGRFFGAGNLQAFKHLTRNLFGWGIALSTLFTAVYALAGSYILSLLTDESAVIALATDYLPFVTAIPYIAFSAFLFDGLFIGTTSTKEMLLSMTLAALLYFLTLILFPLANATLWTAFLVYLGSRGAIQALLLRRISGKFSVSSPLPHKE